MGSSVGRGKKHAPNTTHFTTHTHNHTCIEVWVEACASLPRCLQHHEWRHIWVALWEEHVKHKQAALVGRVLGARDDAAHLLLCKCVMCV